MKVVVTGYDGEQPIYNTHFLSFATHYGFKPWACRRRQPQTKGKIERPFGYIEKNLLNGRTFTSLEHLNEVTATWLANTADLHNHRETKRRPPRSVSGRKAAPAALACAPLRYGQDRVPDREL